MPADTSVETDTAAEQPPPPDNLISRERAPWIGDEIVLRAAPEPGTAWLHLIPMWDTPEVRVAIVRPGGEGYVVEWGEGREVDVLAPDRDEVEAWAIEQLSRYAGTGS